MIHFDLLHGAGNPRNSEGSFLRTRSGERRYVYTRYTGDSWNDHAAADLAELVSSDGGVTWRDRGVIIDRGDAQNVMSASLLRLDGANARLFHLEKRRLPSGLLICVPIMRRSTDDGATWSAPERLIPHDSYNIIHNDRAVLLSSGRIALPVQQRAFRTNGANRASSVFMLYSDDSGDTWHESDTVLHPNTSIETKHGLEEPGLLELEPGKLLCWMRTALGYQYTSLSYDNGNTWSEPLPNLNFPAPNSPMSMKRDPATDIVYAIWNGTDRRLHPVLPHPEGNGRTPLVIVRSLDSGVTWETRDPRLLETDPERGYCYTAMHFEGEKLLVGYCFGRHLDGGSNLQDTRLRIIDIKELWKD